MFCTLKLSKENNKCYLKEELLNLIRKIIKLQKR